MCNRLAYSRAPHSVWHTHTHKRTASSARCSPNWYVHHSDPVRTTRYQSRNVQLKRGSVQPGWTAVRARTPHTQASTFTSHRHRCARQTATSLCQRAAATRSITERQRQVVNEQCSFHSPAHTLQGSAGPRFPAAATKSARRRRFRGVNTHAWTRNEQATTRLSASGVSVGG